MFLFPYEHIKKDSNIVIYGAGTMGTDYILQALRTEYCRIVFALDRAAREKVGFPVAVCPPEYIRTVDPASYDCVLIALQDVNHSNSIRQTLLQYGVEERKIIQAYEVGLNCAGFFPKPDYTDHDTDPDTLHLSFYAYGGIGDTLIATALIKAVRKLIHKPVTIDYYCNYPEIYQRFPFIDRALKLTQFSDSYEYDFSAFVFRNISFQKLNLQKIRRFSETLYRWCVDAVQINEKICDNFRDDCRYSLYAAMKGRNRMEQQNISGILPYDRHTPVYMDWDLAAYAHFREFGLAGKRYLTISSGIESCNTMRNPKLWDIEKYHQLVFLIKRNYPDILVVNVGQNYNFGKIEGTDIDLVGKTSLDDIKVVLKQSLLHIGVEGGLVHLNHFLYGKSCCLFGPTSLSFFGYEENINVSSGTPAQCANGCEGIVFNWMSYGCFLDVEPLCMKSLTTERVFGEISGYLSSLPQFRYKAEKIERNPAQTLAAQTAELVSGETAVIRRVDPAIIRAAAALGAQITVLSENPDMEASWEEEYGSVYNIPSKAERYDTVLNFTLEEESYAEYALKELLRVSREAGTLLLYCRDFRKLRKALDENNVRIPPDLDASEPAFLAIRKQRL